MKNCLRRNFLSALSEIGNPLEQLTVLIDFEMFRPTLEDVLVKKDCKTPVVRQQIGVVLCSRSYSFSITEEFETGSNHRLVISKSTEPEENAQEYMRHLELQQRTLSH